MKDAPNTETPERRRRRNGLIIGGLIVFTLIIYSNTLHVPFVFDDLPNIVERTDLHLRQLTLDSVLDTFTRGKNGDEALHRPVSNFTFALNFYLGGFNVTGYHLVNLAIHMTTAVFLFKTLMLMLAARGNRYSENERLRIAGIAAMLWVIHPIQIQAVTYIVQRMASLAAMFYILGFWAWLRFRLSGNRRYGFFVISGLMAVLAVLTKQNAVMFPVGILLLEWLVLSGMQQPGLGLKKRMAALTVLVLAGMVIAMLAAYSIEATTLFDDYAKKPFTLTERLLTQPRVIFFHLYQILALMPEYYCIDHAFSKSTGLTTPTTTLFAILGIIAATGVAIGLRKRLPLVCFAVLFFLSHHAVESTFLPLQLVFEHRNYLPSLFLFLPVALAVNRLLVFYAGRSRFVYYVIALVTTCTFIFIGMCTHVRNYDWRSPETLWKDASRKYPGITRPYHNLGYYYQRQGAVQKALDTYEIALTRRDHDWKLKKILTLGNMARLYCQRQDYQRAEAALQRAAAIAEKVTGDANAIYKIEEKKYILLLSKIYSHTRPELADETVDRAIKFTKAAGPLGRLYDIKGMLALHRGDFNGARNAFLQVRRLKRNNAMANLKLGVTATCTGALEKGRRYLEQFIAEHPRHAPAHLYLAENRLLARNHDAAEAGMTAFIENTGIKTIKELILNIRKGDVETLPLVDSSRTLELLNNCLNHYIPSISDHSGHKTHSPASGKQPLPPSDG
ncbi:MAG: tetratricopeptide repeat protein [Thermodesulfobacteriota bacterium]|nr:tetratricopeptide repeat protein [Thermodesulfobacteriota bacterium]